MFSKDPFFRLFLNRCSYRYVFCYMSLRTSINYFLTSSVMYYTYGDYDRRISFKVLLITKTCLYSFDPLKPHFYIVKLGFTGVYIIFLILLENIDCGYSLEPPRRGGSNEYPQSMF